MFNSLTPIPVITSVFVSTTCAKSSCSLMQQQQILLGGWVEKPLGMEAPHVQQSSWALKEMLTWGAWGHTQSSSLLTGIALELVPLPTI